MAVTTQHSSQYANVVAVPPVMNGRPAMPYKRRFVHTQSGTGDDGSSVTIARVYAGERLDLLSSMIHHPAFGASRVLKLGWTAHTDPDGTVHAADDDALFSAMDVAAAGRKSLVEATAGTGLEADGTHLFKAGCDLILTCTGGTWPTTSVIKGFLELSPGGP